MAAARGADRCGRRQDPRGPLKLPRLPLPPPRFQPLPPKMRKRSNLLQVVQPGPPRGAQPARGPSQLADTEAAQGRPRTGEGAGGDSVGKDRRTVGGPQGPAGRGMLGERGGASVRAPASGACGRCAAGRVWLDAPRSRVGGIFVVRVCASATPGCVYPRVHGGMCARVSALRARPLRVALRARVAQRVEPRCSSVGWGRHTRFRMSVRVFTRETCVHNCL